MEMHLLYLSTTCTCPLEEKEEDLHLYILGDLSYKREPENGFIAIQLTFNT